MNSPDNENGNGSKIYFNNAATAWPAAPGVIEAIQNSLTGMPYDPGRSTGEDVDHLMECRRLLARLLGNVDYRRIALTNCSTHALNLAISGLGLKDGAHIITTVTEHNSVLRPLRHLVENNKNIRLSLVGLNRRGELDEDEYGRLLKQAPSLVVLNHASNVTGRILDAGRLFADARKVGAVTLLDASQSLGAIPVHPVKLHADLVAFTGHKALRGPAGTGGLYVSPELELDQVIVGGTGVSSDLAFHPKQMPMRLEAGTTNIPAFAGLAAALRWLEKEGEEHLSRSRTLTWLLYECLGSVPGVEVFDNQPEAGRVGVVSFRVEGWDVNEAGYILDESFGIACRTGLHCAPLIHEAIGSAPAGTIRFSVSGFNTEEEVERGITAIRRMAA